MSRSLDKLNQAVTDVLKDASGKTFSKDNLIDIIDDNIGFLRNVTQFFTNLGPDYGQKLKLYMDQNRTQTKLKSIQLYNTVIGGICTAGQRAMNERFLGAIQDTAAGLTAILEEINANIDNLFADKQLTIYNTKISQVALLGMITSAGIYSQWVVDYIALLMSDRSPILYKPVKSALVKLDENVGVVMEMINRVLGNKINKTFVNAIKRYRNAGSDTSIVNSNNQATVQFAKVNNDVTDNDIIGGARGLKIFKWLGDWFVDRTDAQIRKLRAERELLQARVQLLQLELDDTDETSPEYKKQVEIIKNYQNIIDRLNQKIEKLEAE